MLIGTHNLVQDIIDTIVASENIILPQCMKLKTSVLLKQDI